MGLIETALVIGATASVATATTSAIEGKRARTAARRTGRAQAAALRAEASAERERGRRRAAAQRAAFGAAGVGPSGTPFLVQEEDLIQTLRAVKRILAGARNVEVDARAQGRAAQLRGFGGFATGLSRAASFVGDPRFPNPFTGATQSATGASGVELPATAGAVA